MDPECVVSHCASVVVRGVRGGLNGYITLKGLEMCKEKLEESSIYVLELFTV